MAQYINKDALVAEIKRLKTIYNDDENIHHVAKYNILVDILTFINTLEAKEAVLLTPEEIKKICTIYDNLKQERECATVLYNSDETFFNHVLMEYKAIASPKQ